MSFWGQLAALLRSKKIHLSQELVEDVVQRYEIPSWFAYIYRERSSRWESWESCLWLARQLPYDARILETGCGTAANLIWFGQHGFGNLYGFDIDPKVLGAAGELCKTARVPAHLWLDGGLNPSRLPFEAFDAILALNWTHLLESFDLKAFLEIYRDRITKRGYIVVDVIDEAYNQVPKNQYLTSDWDKPEDQRRPSEYKRRYSREQVNETVHGLGLRIERVISHPEVVPRCVYIISL